MLRAAKRRWLVLFGRIDKILRTTCPFRRGVTVSIGRNIGLQSAEEGRHLHRARHFAHPDVHAGFQFLKMALHAKTRLLHKIGGEEAVDSRHDPGMILDVAIAEPEFSDGSRFFTVHWHNLSIPL